MTKKKYKSIYFLIFVLLILVGVVFFQITAVYTKSMMKDAELQSLQQELSDEQQRQITLQDEMESMDSDDFIMKKAREEFNLVQDDEILFIQKDD